MLQQFYGIASLMNKDWSILLGSLKRCKMEWGKTASANVHSSSMDLSDTLCAFLLLSIFAW